MAETHIWIEPDGTMHTLGAKPGVGVRFGIAGRGMPPVHLQEHAVPGQPGIIITGARFGAREIDLPIRIQATDEIDLDNRIRDLMDWFDPTKGDGRYRVIKADGTQREIVCRLSGGGTLEEGEDRAVFYQRELLVLKASDPYWQSVNESSELFNLDNTTATFFPIFPIRLTSETIFADATITNNGDAEAWPVWDIWGPGENPTITNLNTGKRIALSREPVILGAGETITIDTRPGQKTVVGNDGENLFPMLTLDSSLWAFPKGSTAVRVEMSGATQSSQVMARYRERWRTS